MGILDWGFRIGAQLVEIIDFTMKNALIFLLAACCIASCLQSGDKKKLPIVGEPDISPAGDTVYPTIPDFSFMDQDSQIITNATFKDKIYVVDFFFIHCTTICPKVKKNCQRIYEKYKDDDRIAILSHSIDTKHDTVPALRKYANKLNISSNRWHLVTGPKDAIYGIADNYFIAAKEDTTVTDGFDHSGRLILVDKSRHVRAYCEGTDYDEVTRFMNDIDILLEEQFPPAISKQ